MSGRISRPRSVRDSSSREHNDVSDSIGYRRALEERSRGDDHYSKGSRRLPSASDAHGRVDLSRQGGNDGLVLNFSYGV